MKIRKQVYELTIEDLNRFPVWEFGLDEEGEEGQDEATVRPRKIKEPLDPSEETFIVRAVFTLVDRTILTGYLTPSPEGDNGISTVSAHCIPLSLPNVDRSDFIMAC